MRRVLQFIAGGVLALGLIFIGFYLVAIRPNQLFVQAHQDEFYKKGDQFLDCMIQKQPEACWYELTSENFRKNISQEAFGDFANKVRLTLGERINSIPVDNSLSWFGFTGSGGPKLYISFQLTTNFVKEPNANEAFSLVRSENGDLLVEKVVINSQKMMK